MASPNMTTKPGYLASNYIVQYYLTIVEMSIAFIEMSLLHSYKLHNIRKLRPWYMFEEV